MTDRRKQAFRQFVLDFCDFLELEMVDTDFKTRFLYLYMAITSLFFPKMTAQALRENIHIID